MPASSPAATGSRSVTDGPTEVSSPLAGEIVLADSSAIVYLVEGEPHSPRRAAVEAFLAEAAERGAKVVASTIAWTELLEKPLAAGDDELAARYRRVLADSSRFELRVVDAAIAEQAAVLAASLRPAFRKRLSPADLVHIATALVAGASAILGNDEAWRAVPQCPKVILVDELVFEQG